jgi:hypothetical protein
VRPLLGVAAAGAFLTLAACYTTFQEDVNFLSRHTEVVLLTSRNEPVSVAICPAFQGRVMTSTAGGPAALSLGWINRALIESGQTQKHINPYGGEDRFWLGPEGGPFSIFFAQGASQDVDHWFTPAPIDTEPFILADQQKDRATLRKAFHLENASGAHFEVDVHREIRLYTVPDAWKHLELAVDEFVNVVGFESVNKITNVGKNEWKKESGLLSIWILGMFPPSRETTVVVPFHPGTEADFGPVLNDAYFGKVPADRLRVGGQTIFFKGDGQRRSKIGVPPKRARPVFGSYDPVNEVLTIIQFSLPDANAVYVNSMWGSQKNPYQGDALNSYNDGPVSPGAAPLGPFYELESSSPAAALKPGQSLRHIHRTYHFQGPRERVSEIAVEILGVSLDQITHAFSP